jgi:hypothetical protein
LLASVPEVPSPSPETSSQSSQPSSSIPDSQVSFWPALIATLTKHYGEEKGRAIASVFHHNHYELINKLSLDDIEMIAPSLQ